MNIRVADIQACYELWRSRGAEFITEPRDKYGETLCYIRDPDGYIIEVGQRLLVIWGKYDLSFDPSEPEAYHRDVPNADLHVLDAGHFALDTAADEIAGLVRAFMR